MDNLTHSLIGMALGRAGLARRGRLAMSTLVIANNLPDIDVALYATSTDALALHRGSTHGVLAPVILPIVLTVAMVLFDRYRKKPSPSERVDVTQLLLLSFIGVLLHLFMDFTNSYGIRLLMPFSDRWFYGDALYIVDPWLWLSLGGGWWFSKKTPRTARIGVTLAAIYVITMLVSNVVARREVRQGLTRAGQSADTRFMVTPVIANPFRREVVIDVGDRYEKGNLWFDPMPHFRPAGFGIDKGLTQPEIQAAMSIPSVRAYVRWSRFPFAQVEPNGTAWLNDYRYANVGPYGWSAFKISPLR